MAHGYASAMLKGPRATFRTTPVWAPAGAANATVRKRTASFSQCCFTVESSSPRSRWVVPRLPSPGQPRPTIRGHKGSDFTASIGGPEGARSALGTVRGPRGAYTMVLVTHVRRCYEVGSSWE